ncbi:flippase [bacterium]|nr:flippase [bacterium]
MTQEKRVFLDNFFSLASLQLLNYVLPLLTFPYLVRVLGAERYGLLAFSLSMMQYCTLLTDYGFGLTAVRDVAMHRDQKVKIDAIFSSVTSAKIVLLGCSLLMLIIAVGCQQRLRAEWLFYLLAFGIVIDNITFPIWFFQGMEDMKYIARRNIIIKVVFTILIFILVRSDQDYLKVPLINLIGYLLAGGASLYVIFNKYQIRFNWPDWKDILEALKHGFPVFLARASISLVATSNLFFLGLFRSHEEVGYYAAAERIVFVMLWVANPAFQVFYPFISKIAHQSKERALKLIGKFMLLIFTIYLAIYLVSNIFLKQTLSLILGAKFAHSHDIFHLLSMQLLFAPLIYILSNVVFMAFRMEKYFSRVFIVAGVINIILLYLILGVWGLGGIAVAKLVVLMQACLLVVFLIIMKKKLL